MQYAKGRMGDCPGPRKETTTRRSVTRGAIYPPPSIIKQRPDPHLHHQPLLRPSISVPQAARCDTGVRCFMSALQVVGPSSQAPEHIVVEDGPVAAATFGGQSPEAAALADALEAADGVLDGRCFGRPIVERVGPNHTVSRYTYRDPVVYRAPPIRAPSPVDADGVPIPHKMEERRVRISAPTAAALDAADGVMDGKFFGLPIVDQTPRDGAGPTDGVMQCSPSSDASNVTQPAPREVVVVSDNGIEICNVEPDPAAVLMEDVRQLRDRSFQAQAQVGGCSCSAGPKRVRCGLRAEGWVRRRNVALQLRLWGQKG